MPQVLYLTPGVYVEEVPSGARPIGPVGTSTAAFVGVAPDRAAHVDKALAVNNWSEFLRLYADGEQLESTPLARAVFGFLDNGGTRCWVVNVGEGGQLTGTGGAAGGGLQLLEAVDEVSILAAPGFHDPVVARGAAQHGRAAAHHGGDLRPGPGHRRHLRADAASPPRSPEAGRRRQARRRYAEAAPTRRRRRAGAPAPAVGLRRLLLPVDHGAATRSAASWCSPRRAGTSPASGRAPTPCAACTRRRPTRSSAAPSTSRYRVTRAEQDVLNPTGVNCIRFFAGEGIRVWGARTLAAERERVALPQRAPALQHDRGVDRATAPGGWSSSRTTARSGSPSGATSARS